MTTSVELRHLAGSTRIELLDSRSEVCPALLDLAPSAARLFVLTDDGGAGPHGAALVAELVESGRVVESIVLQAGESAKTLATVEGALDQLLDRGVRRHDRVVAVGGGVLGDEAGLAAALALRGVPLIQVPTTLVAMVDSSIGGKTGVDHRTGKNRIGAFHQAEAVLVATEFLETLPPRELGAGMFEVAKAALLAGEAEVQLVERHLDGGAGLAEVIEMAIRLKVGIVAADEREGGARRLLNLGHTIGHALEAATDYLELRHGEAVGWGMLVALELSRRVGRLDPAIAARLGRLVERIGPRPSVDRLSFSELRPFLSNDKKQTASGLAWVLLDGPGQGVVTTEVEVDQVEQSWESVRAGGTGSLRPGAGS